MAAWTGRHLAVLYITASCLVATSLGQSVTIGFDPSSYSIMEGDTVRVTVSVLGSTPLGGSVVVTVQTMDGTAIATRDYTGVTQNLTLTPSMTSDMVNIPTNFNESSDETRNFMVTLSTSEDLVVLSPQTSNVTINNIVIPTVEDKRVTEGRNATFTFVIASGPTLQWYYNGANISDGSEYTGTTTNTLTVLNASQADEGDYSCNITTSFGLSYSTREARLDVFEPAVIVIQPTSMITLMNETAMFSVNATGEGLTYQWQRNGSDISNGNKYSGVDTATLIVMDVERSDEGVYRCVVTNGAGNNVTSNGANLTVVFQPTIVMNPVPVTNVAIGGNASFTVVADGNSLMYQWFRIDNNVEMVISGATDAMYTINNVAEADDGSMYFCMVSNAVGSVNTTMVTLTLVPFPSFTQHPQPDIVGVGNTATFTCSATSADNETVTITWSVEGMNEMLTGTSIMVTPDMVGVYNVTCMATNSRGTSLSETTLTAITVTVKNVTVEIDNPATLVCVVDPPGVDGLQYRWYTTLNAVVGPDPLPTVRFDNRVTGNDTDMLVFSSVERQDGTFIYVCNVSYNGELVVTSQPASLTVLAPEIVTGPMDVSLTAGDDLVLNCTARNAPGSNRTLIIEWLFDARVIQNNTFNESAEVVSEYRVDNVTTSDRGRYTCAVYNTRIQQADRESANVTVFFTPEIMFENRTIPEGSLRLECNIIAMPIADFAEIVRIESDGNRTQLSNTTNNDGEMMFFFTAMIGVTLADDGAQFECLANNSNGQANVTITITVQARPAVIDHNNDVSSEVISLSSVNITWRIPSNNNDNITHYLINYCQVLPQDTCNPALVTPRNLSVADVNLNATHSSFNLSGLTVDNTYRVAIRAGNSIGEQMSPTVQNGFMFESASANNGSVVNIRNIRFSLAVILTWNIPPLAMSSDVVPESFQIEYARADNIVSMQQTVMYNASLMEQGLYINLSNSGEGPHNFSITANYGTPTFNSTPSTVQITVPQQPSPLISNGRVTFSAPGASTTLTLTWPAPNNNNFLSVYRVTYSSTPVSSRRRRQAETMMTVEYVNSSSTSLNVTMFAPHSVYTVNVDAVYSPPGAGGAQVVVPLIPQGTITSPQRTASPPRDIVTVATTDIKINVSWTAPENPNGVISGYMVCYNMMCISVSGTRTQTPSLDPNTMYSVTVQAVNGFGDGEQSTPKSVMTLFGVVQPRITNAVVRASGTLQFTIQIARFDDTLGALSDYSIVVIVGDPISNTESAIPDSTLQPSGISQNTYYVAVRDSADPQRSTNQFIIGSGIGNNYNNVMYPNDPLQEGVSYYVFVRLYSAIDGRFRDSELSVELRRTTLNAALIVGPIAAVAVVLLLILVILLVVVFIFTRPSKRGGYRPADSDGVRGKKKGGGIEMRRTRLFSPVVNVPVPDVFTSAGQPTTLVCEASGTPAPEVVWTRNNEPLDKERFIQLADSSLFINDTDLKDEGQYIITATNSAGSAEQMVRVTVISPSPPESDPEHPPIKVGEFSEKIALLRANDDEGLEDEYLELEPDITFTSYAAKLNINKNKNRYINIIPYDHSRVVMSLQDNTPGSDYINASFIDGYNRPGGYIASQGPQPSTFPDFWRMIWELDCPTIVMVTNLKEEDKIKCHQYWPSYGTTTYGNVQVTLKGVENLAEYSIRTFHVAPIAGQSRVPMPTREVKQFHFLVWPDHGVPQFATPLLSFRKRVAKYHPDKKGPMVVHCSAGVGRTGTFITIDTMLKKMEEEGIVDIFNFVRAMRYKRNYMVQTPPQYVFIHDAMLEAIMCGDNSIPAPELRKKFQDMLEIDPESKKSRIQLQFENLNANSPQDEDFDCTIAGLPDNQAKNRSKCHLPANEYRVPLGAPPPRSGADEDEDDDDDDDDKKKSEDEEPDYICATYADGYRQRNAFIITQAPMKNTVGDFWRMVWEQKSAAIVMLTELEEQGKEMSVKYWPGEVGEAGLFGSFQLELSEDEKDKGDYVTRKFKLSHVDAPQECRIVTQFHFTKWSHDSTPKSCQSIIDLIDEIQRVQRKSGNQPITIHCDDGIGRTGAFCTLYCVLERVKVDQVVDVYLATKTLRIQRAGLLQTLDQYIFVHKAVIEFLDSFSDYQNFK